MKLKPQALATILACMLSSALRVDAQVLQTLCSFNGTNGANPQAGVTLGCDGNLYGATRNGGSAYGDSGYGTVFKLTTNGTLTILASFRGTNGAYPSAGLTLGPDRNFYGTTWSGGSGYGTVFQVTTNGTLNTLVSFNNANGSNPYAGLTLGSDGNFYGTTAGGGTANAGTVFKVSTGGSLTTVASFTGFNGDAPEDGLTLGNDGNFYGTTWYGGSNGAGNVFQVTTNGTLTPLVYFNDSNGYAPYAGLTQGNDGNFYGTTTEGGANSGGTVFKVTTNGTLTTLVSFNFFNGQYPWAGLTLGPDGNFYGTTKDGGIDDSSDGYGAYAGGTVFKVTPSGTLTTLYFFNAENPNSVIGAYPVGALTLGKDGNFYGTTASGGSGGNGTIFRLLMPPVAQPTLALQFSAGYPQLIMTGTLGYNYVVQCCTNLASPKWFNLLSLTNLQTSPVSFLDPSGVVPTGRFYRAITQ